MGHVVRAYGPPIVVWNRERNGASGRRTRDPEDDSGFAWTKPAARSFLCDRAQTKPLANTDSVDMV